MLPHPCVLFLVLSIVMGEETSHCGPNLHTPVNDVKQLLTHFSRLFRGSECFVHFSLLKGTIRGIFHSPAHTPHNHNSQSWVSPGQEWLLGVPRGYGGPSTRVMCCPRPLAEGRLRSGAAGTQAGAHVGCHNTRP